MFMVDWGEVHVRLMEVGDVGSASRLVGGSNPKKGMDVTSVFPLAGSV
jgi:hypothetical protein